MVSTQPENRLGIGVKEGTHIVLFSTNSALVFPFALGKALVIVKHIVEAIDVGKHRVLLMPSDVLAVQFTVVIHLDRDHSGAVDNPFLLVHHDFNGFFPAANNPFTVLIKTH